MAYICEEAEFHLIQFFFLLQRFLFLHTNHLLPVAAVYYVDQPED